MTTDVLMACLVGGWTSSIMYRRPFMSILLHVHKHFDFSIVDQEHPKVVSLPRKVAQELQLLSALVPLIASNLAAKLSTSVFATDASEFGGACVETEVHEDLARSLWRSGRKKGGYARLISRVEALRKQADPDYEELSLPPANASSGPAENPKKPLANRFNFIEICGGAGKVASRMASKGWSVGPVIDPNRSPAYNFRFLELLRWLFFLVEDGLVDSWMLEPPCTTFSAAAHPCLRSYRMPRGFDPTDERTHIGTELALGCLALMPVYAICDVGGLLNQPLLSKMAWLEEWRVLLWLGLCHKVKFSSCMFNPPHKKEFRMLAANMNTASLAVRCDGTQSHVPIAGKYTKPSAVYTDELADALADAFVKMRKQQSHDGNVAGLENPVINDVLLTASWKLHSAWRWKGKAHINIYEAATYGRLLY